MTRIHDLFLPPDHKPHRDTPPQPTGAPTQAAITPRQRHHAKRNVRIAAVAFRRWIGHYHPRLSPDRLLRLPPHTLVRWQRRWIASKLRAKPRGRPRRVAPLNHRNEVIHLLDALGPHVGCSTLQLFFPLMARRPLTRLLQRYRRIWRKRNRLKLHELHWHRPGSVWAIDYTKPPAPIDGLYSSILVVRDLASGYQLLALPTTDQTAKTACDALLPLFRKFGPPIVLKSDNGSFRAHEMIRFLNHWNVCPLLSPPRTPQYNGAVEAGIGSINTRAHHIAAQHGRPGEWTCDDVEAARLLANATERPHGRRGPTPLAAWKRRDDIAHAERIRFFETLKLFQQRLDSRRQAESPSAEPQARTHRDPALSHRIAIRRALVARHLLTLTKPRRITPPIKSQKVDKIT